jgi:hypothetical protein
MELVVGGLLLCQFIFQDRQSLFPGCCTIMGLYKQIWSSSVVNESTTSVRLYAVAMLQPDQ